jgi:hypothetical protein
MKLQDILSEYADPQMRLAVRMIRNRAITEAKVPQTGAYWWLPVPGGQWELDVYYDSDFRGNTMHDRMWLKYVVERLAILWNKDADKLRRLIGDKYAGMPRGRIGKAMSRYVLSHGGDAPIANGLKKVTSAFNLTALMKSNTGGVHDRVCVSKDEHECMLPGDPEAVQKAIGAKLGLKGSFSPDLGDDGYNDDYNDEYRDDYNDDEYRDDY